MQEIRDSQSSTCSEPSQKVIAASITKIFGPVATRLEDKGSKEGSHCLSFVYKSFDGHLPNPLELIKTDRKPDPIIIV